MKKIYTKFSQNSSKGINLHHYKKAAHFPIEEAPLPPIVCIPLNQHTGSMAEAIVKIGEKVKTGQLIAAASSPISSNIHASVSGVVTKIDDFPHPVVGQAKTVVIESDGKDEKIFKEECFDYNMLSTNEIKEKIKNAGVVGLGGAAFPTHVKLSPPADKKIDTFIVNAVECEPYLSCDYRLLIEQTQAIIAGINIVLKAIGAKKCIIALEDNKKDAIRFVEKAVRNNTKTTIAEIKTVVLPTKYPRGAEKYLVKMAVGREIPPGGLPFDVRCIVSNVGTVFSIYEAVVKNKPLYERIVTVSGSVKMKHKNLKVRIGTPVSQIADFCEVDLPNVGKIIFGGPMMGITQKYLDTPVIKSTSGILFFKKGVFEPEQFPCIRCGKCIDVCGMNLMPTKIAKLVKHNSTTGLEELNIIDCIECGSCQFICPSKIPLVELIKIGKIKVRSLKTLNNKG